MACNPLDQLWVYLYSNDIHSMHISCMYMYICYVLLPPLLSSSPLPLLSPLLQCI